jgi:hypothetical protein
MEILLGGKAQDPIGHCCLDLIRYQTKISPGFREAPFLDGLGLFVDGSSRVIQGKRHNVYLVVDGVKLKVIESGFPNNGSAQSCKLFTLNPVL